MVIDLEETGSIAIVFARGVVGGSQRLPSVAKLGRAGADTTVTRSTEGNRGHHRIWAETFRGTRCV